MMMVMMKPMVRNELPRKNTVDTSQSQPIDRLSDIWPSVPQSLGPFPVQQVRQLLGVFQARGGLAGQLDRLLGPGVVGGWHQR